MAQDNATKELTADEYALYDRQVRLWGAQAQQSIGAAHVLIVSMRALGTEIAKNLTLAGFGSITIIDDGLVVEEDLGACYFLREEDIGKPRAESAIPRLQELNPRVKIQAGQSFITLTASDPTYYSAYDLVVACDLDFFTTTLINAAVRLAARPFYAASIHGEYGYIFADLVDHQFITERENPPAPSPIGTQESVTRSILAASMEKPNGAAPAKEIITKREIYCPLILANSSPLEPSITKNPRKLRNVPALLPALRALFDFQRLHGKFPDPNSGADLANFTTSAKEHAEQLFLPAATLTAEFLKSFVLAMGTELPPTASFIGSRLSEDIINVITHRNQPIQNFALFDGEIGPIYTLYSVPPQPPSDVPLSATATNGDHNGLPQVGHSAANGSIADHTALSSNTSNTVPVFGDALPSGPTAPEKVISDNINGAPPSADVA